MPMRALVFFLLGASLLSVRADDGYRLWLRYDRIADEPLRAAYASVTQQIVFTTPTGTDSSTLAVAREELTTALRGLLGTAPQITLRAAASEIPSSDDGYSLTTTSADTITLTAPRDIGILYGAFALLREIQLHHSLDHLTLTSAPRIQRRILNHWDNLNRFVERGYAGFSLWEWPNLPDIRSPRYRDYARACASIGLNGAVLTNVNANALVLTRRTRRRVPPLRHPRLSLRSFQRPHRNRRTQNRRPARPCRHRMVAHEGR